MIARLRAFLASWRRPLLVAVGCLAYLTLFAVTAHLLPQVVSSLGRVGLIIVVILVFLWGIAVLALSGIVAYLLGAILTPILTRAFPETPWTERSDKAKEKFADGLLSVSHALMGATAINTFVVPFTVLLQAVVSRTDVWALLSPLLQPGGVPGWLAMLLLVLFFLSAGVARRFRMQALDIYDEIARTARPHPASPGTSRCNTNDVRGEVEDL